MVVGKIDELIREGRAVSENANWIVVNVKAVGSRFDNNGFSSISDNPMEITCGEVGIKIVSIETHVGEFCAGFSDAGAITKNIGDELVGSNIILAGDFVKIDSVIRKAETSDTEAHIVYGIVVEGIILAICVWYNIGDADDGMMCGEVGKSSKVEGEVVGCDGNGFVIRIVEVEVATEVSIFSLIDG